MLLDIFDDDAFSLHSLTAAIDKLPYVPGRLGKMGIFKQAPITTTIAIVEERQGTLALVPAMARGQQGSMTNSSDRRTIRSFVVPHNPQFDAVYAAELEGKRAFGSEDQTEVFSQIVNDKLEVMKSNHELTFEYHRIGAIQGIVLDADGSTVLYNWFTQFGITEQTVAFDFNDTGDYDNAAPASDIKVLAQLVRRMIENALGGTPFTGINAECGDQFFDALVSHATVRRAYERYQENSFSRNLQTDEKGFEFAGITWRNYRGSVGSVDFIENSTARFYPAGTQNIFLEIPAPADFVETVNTRGKPIYVKQERMKYDKGIELHSQSNVLYMCTRPRCLVKGIGTNTNVPLS